ncbi:hypothetical protein AOLI_G00090090 [Acnodon oligacanthus]
MAVWQLTLSSDSSVLSCLIFERDLPDLCQAAPTCLITGLQKEITISWKDQCALRKGLYRDFVVPYLLGKPICEPFPAIIKPFLS